MKEIKLTRGYVAVVDDEDYDWLMKKKWHASTGRHVMVRSTVSRLFDGYRWTRSITMHRFIMDAQEGQIVDHINGDPMDNRRENLRFVTSSQNAQNSRGPKMINGKPPSSRFKGVAKKIVKYKGNPRYVSWNSQICFDSKKIHIANCETEVEAACMYDLFATGHFGKYARPNFDGAAYDKWYTETYGAA